MKCNSIRTARGIILVVLLGILTMIFVLRLIPSVSGTTFVEEDIRSDTTWTEVDSPFQLTKSIDVNNGATLTIEPGVVVKFGENFNLDVYGNLSAIGSESKTINFTSGKVSPEIGDWESISFHGGEDKFELKYCVVEYAEDGVNMYGGGSGFIEHSIFRYNVRGLEGIINIPIEHNEIHDNQEDGIWISTSSDINNINICNNLIYSNGKNKNI